MKKLTKPQQALLERINNGEKIWRSFSGNFHGDDGKTIARSVIEGLRAAGLIVVEKEEIAMRLYYVLRVKSSLAASD